MAKGFLAGTIWGLVASTIGAGAVSLAVGAPPERAGMPAPEDVALADLPSDLPADPATGIAPDAVPQSAPPSDPGTPVATVPDMPPETPADTPPVRFEENTDTLPTAAPPPAPALRPGVETDIAAPQVGALDAPDVTASDPLSASVTEPAAMPDPAQDSGSLPTPDATAPAADVVVADDAPVLPSVQAALPDAPRPETEPSIASEPAQPPQPQVPDDQSGLVPETAEAPTAPTPEPEATPPATAETPAEPEIATAEPMPEPAPAPAPSPAPEPAPEPELASDPDPAPATDPDPEQSARILPSVQPDDETTGRPAIGTPGVSLVNRAPAVPETRLPSLGTDTADTAPDSTTEAPATSPLILFGAPVDVAADLPRFSIVLIDDGTGPLGPDTLDAFPFPVTFALDPSRPGAADRMAGYRAQGFEVIALAGVPDGAQPSDVEVTLAATLGGLPEAVAVMENPILGLQGSRAISDQVTEVLRDSGHGLVMLPKGLNTATALAAREGVPAATVFKDFDGDGQDPRTIRRFLDGAAFRARQEGSVIVLGRLKADTLSALLLWGLQDRASQVALVPVSLVLREAAGL